LKIPAWKLNGPLKPEPTPDVFKRFLAAAKFLNGFEAMRRLSIANRIKWMKICAMVWGLKERIINDFRFDSDDQKTGLDLDRRLQTLAESQLNRHLIQIDGGMAPDSSLDIRQVNQQKIFVFGVRFSVMENRTLEIDLQ
jgi:hypothetical protein